MKRKITNSLMLLTFTFFATVASYAQQVINETLQNDGRTRQYRLYVPASYDPGKPAPLILNFHGFTNTIDIQYNQSNFQQLAEDNQFIFVTPQGLGGFFAGWAINNNFGGNEDDLGFSDALIDKIKEDYNINDKRIYATGFSNGGFFSYRLACELSPRIAAVASVAGSMTRGWIDSGQCQPQHPTAVLQITGTNDNVIAIGGNGTNEPIQDVMEYWAAVNNADTTPDTVQLGGGSTRFIWDNGDNGTTAEFIRVQGKGHSWNGGNVNTSQEIWDFFSRFDIDGAIDPTNPPNEDCAATITSFPYRESFENGIGQWSQAVNDDLNWTRNSGGTPSDNTGPSNATDGNFYLFVEASGNGTGFPNKRAILNSPCLNFSSVSEPRLNFEYHMFGSAINSMTVEARTNNTGSWSSVFNQSGNQGNSWNSASVNLSAFAGNDNVQLRFVVVTGSGNNGWQSDIAIDGITIQNGGVDPDPDPDCAILNFANATISGFGGQDFDGDFEVALQGNGLILRNNTWKQIPFAYTITPNTVLQFDFRSTSQGEIHAIGFETNNTLTEGRYFKVHGTQNYGVTNFDNYTGSATVTYTIPVGNFYTGAADRLVFINDNDTGSGNNSLFSNVRIFEGSCNGVSAADAIAGLGNKAPLLGNEDEGTGAITIAPNPTSDRFSLTIGAKSKTETIITIYSALGQKKYEGKLNPGENTLSANSLALSSGIYLVAIKSEGGEAIVQKLIVQ